MLVIRDGEEFSSELKKFQCQKCGKLLGKYQGCKQLEIKCPRCRHTNVLNPK
ncbi:MAG: Com family DNA-binding transcriptional regulator [Syntrophomonas sp.]